MVSFLIRVYAYLAYAFAAASLLVLAAFLNDLPWPRGIDAGAAGPLGPALIVDTALIALFALQHSAMARSGFKRRLRGRAAALERSTYVLVSAGVVALLVWAWQPLPAEVWSVAAPWRALLWGLHALGWIVLVSSAHLLSHAALFGLAQAHAHAEGRPFHEPGFETPGLYRLVRHPMMSGVLLLLWATPDASVGRLLLAAGLTLYILSGTVLEERDLHRTLGGVYTAYCAHTPRFVPLLPTWMRRLGRVDRST